MKGRRCEGLTAAGNQCRRRCQPGEMLCNAHSIQADAQRDQQKADVVEALSKLFGFGAACRAVKISAQTVKWWRDEDPAFHAACIEARSLALDTVEAALMRRAVGWTEPATGKFLWSDRAAELLLRGERSQYRQSYVAPPVIREPTKVEKAAREIFENPELAAQMDEIFTAIDGD